MASTAPTSWRPRLAFALREALRDGYSWPALRADALAGVTVGLVALPLAMALAIASGVEPQRGLYTSIVAGAAIPLLGGSRLSVAGPTAAFVVILAPIAASHGTGGLLLATLLAGLILVLLGLSRMGRLIQFIPYPVTTGFTAGIGTVIALLQVKDLLGLTVSRTAEHTPEKVLALVEALPTIHWPDLGIGAFTFVLLLWWPRVTHRLPAPLVALALGAAAAELLRRFLPGFEVATIGNRFSYVVDGVTMPGIPRIPPVPLLPWTLPGPGGQPLVLSMELLRSLIGPAFAIAMLGAIESLLCAVVADGMADTRHDPDVELVAQGAGNLLAPFFGGVPATGAVARTATNFRAGARSPLAAVIHAAFVLTAVLALAPLLSYLPMAALAALLLLVAWNMSDVKHVAGILRIAPGSDRFVLLACFALTVVFDMTVAVIAGVGMAAFLFMGRMSAISGTTLIAPEEHHVHHRLPPGVALYRIAGPLFFGAANKAMAVLESVTSSMRGVILDLEDVSTMDVTGVVALRSAIQRLQERGVHVALAGLKAQPRLLLSRSGVLSRRELLTWGPSIDKVAESLARDLPGIP